MKKKKGFTLIEVIVAITVLLIIVVSVLMLAVAAGASLKNSEQLDMAKNIATYTIEYIRSRNVTGDNNFIGTTQWYPATNSYPGIIDLKGDSLQINANPALPNQAFNVASTAFYSSLQGFVSLKDDPGNDYKDPTQEDINLRSTGGKYYDRTKGDPIVVRYPFTPDSPNAIKNFDAESNYIPRIYTTDSKKLDPSSIEYDQHYTNQDKDKCTAYRGFRVLTQIVARTKDPNYKHVQYYDVKVTVFWMAGNKEHSYSISTQIAAYGG
ncbi:MAG: prepilin-type N-terminal cleavage/methylation domain-containing protein [Caldisericum sp.]|jgi:prepilin-type N-terminal cleavage/methylation domain-containing protein|nr:prepilin-type N-terminal cleavage/methylation domain-containing protein [Caldisericum sp.]